MNTDDEVQRPAKVYPEAMKDCRAISDAEAVGIAMEVMLKDAATIAKLESELAKAQARIVELETLVPDINSMTARFLGWKLPEDFCPDCYIAFNREEASGQHQWPTGTNLFTATEAKSMFEYCTSPRPQPPKGEANG